MDATTRPQTDDVGIARAQFLNGETDEAVSLRERKKAKTRAALIEVSQRLFAERGYSRTTLDDISVEVDITPQTLLRYFETKAQLALAPLSAPLEKLESFLLAEDRSVDTLSIWRQHVQLEAAEAANPSATSTANYLANLRAYHRWVDKDPLLVASLSGIERKLQEVLTRALARDAAVDPGDLHSTLVAAMLVAGRRAIWDRWLELDHVTNTIVEDQHAVIDYVVYSLTRTGPHGLDEAGD